MYSLSDHTIYMRLMTFMKKESVLLKVGDKYSLVTWSGCHSRVFYYCQLKAAFSQNGSDTDWVIIIYM